MVKDYYVNVQPLFRSQIILLIYMLKLDLKEQVFKCIHSSINTSVVKVGQDIYSSIDLIVNDSLNQSKYNSTKHISAFIFGYTKPY